MNEYVHIVCPHCSTINRVLSNKLDSSPKCGRCKDMLFNARPIKLTSFNFQKHIDNNHIPVVVDFWADWCGPCKIMAPVVEQAAAKLEPHVRMAKVNTETEQGLSVKFNIRSIPTIIIFREGREVARQSGAMDLASLLMWVKSSV